MNKLIIISLASISSIALSAVRPVPDNENIYSLLEGSKQIRSLDEIQRYGLNKSSTGIDLWSGHYWPHYQGSLAIRYRDPLFQKLIQDKEQFDKFKELSEKKPLYLYSGKEEVLSPAEKYDLLVGDTEMGLTKYSWEIGQKVSVLGNVPTWRGICDGWSSAAQMMPRPTKSVTLKSPTETPITFYPEDIKALGSLLYSRAQNNVIFLGKRCQSAVVGLITGACDATNPGAFHMALVNRVGQLKKTFIADVSTSSEVWNYPVKNYEFSYYNVFNEEESSNFKDVMELFIKKHRFKKYHKRHDRTYAIVGVKAVVNYADMRSAHTHAIDSAAQDLTMQKVYYYDLEIDNQFKILGGEWFGETAPDFIWAPNDKIYPMTDAEREKIPETPSEITKAAKSSSKKGQPLSVIVQKLFELSK